jgi:hypothetical protein
MYRDIELRFPMRLIFAMVAGRFALRESHSGLGLCACRLRRLWSGGDHEERIV